MDVHENKQIGVLVMATDIKIRFIALPNVLGAEWIDPENGDTYQLAVPRPSASGTVLFGNRSWRVVVTNPERFGPTPTDKKTMLAYAEAFVAAREEEVS